MKKPLIIEIAILFSLFFIFFATLIFVFHKVVIEPNLYTIEFQDIDGITKGSPVRLMGINIGYVRRLKTTRDSVEVQVLITKKDVKIPNGAKARVEFYGLGGSKSIELMPPDDNCGAGIVTNKTIRIYDMVDKSKGLVAILEIVEKIFNDVNETALEKTLKSVSEMKEIKVSAMISELSAKKEEYSVKIKEMKEKQHSVHLKIKRANDMVEKINKFIKE